MTDAINQGYYQPSQGSLTGFTDIDLPQGNPVLSRVGWSLDQLYDFLTNQSDINFPTEDFVRWVDEQINTHINNFNNPHRVTLDQIIGDVIQDILSNVTPGTIPELPPFFSYEGECPLPLGDIYPATYTYQNLYRMSSGGLLIDPSTEDVTLGVDYLTNRGGIPLFSSLTNLIANDWATNNNYRINTQISNTPLPTLNYPFPFYLVSETNLTGNFGVYIPYNRQTNLDYTLSFFLLPTIEGGTIVIRQENAPTETMEIDLKSKKFTLLSPNLLGDIFVYASGVMRVSLTFKATSSQQSYVLQILHRNENETALSRVGQEERALFYYANPIVSTNFINQPVLIDNSQSLTTSPLTFDLSRVNIPNQLSDLVLTLSLNLYPSLNNKTIDDSLIVQFGAITLERDANNVYLKLNGTVLTQTPILAGLNVFSISYAPTLIQFKSLNTQKQQFPGAYNTLSTSTFKAGPCAGYLYNLALYALSDTNQILEHLTNA